MQIVNFRFCAATMPGTHGRDMSILDSIGNGIVEIGAAVAAGLTTVAVGWQKIRKTINADGAENRIIELLRSEVNRLGEQNTKLAISLNEMQATVLQLQAEKRELSHQVENLTEEVTRLREDKVRLSRRCDVPGG